MVNGVALSHANIMSMPGLNVALSAYLVNAVNLLKLNNHYTFDSHVNLNRNRINNLLLWKLTSDAITILQVHKLVGRKYGTLIFNRNNISILHKCAIYRLIYPICVYIKNTPEVPIVSWLPLMSPTNDENTTNKDDFNKSIQYLNYFSNNNPMTFTSCVNNQEFIT